MRERLSRLASTSCLSPWCCSQLVEQPAILERAAATRLIETVRHDQRVGIAELDAHGEHHVAAQRAKRRHAQVAVDQHEATRGDRAAAITVTALC